MQSRGALVAMVQGPDNKTYIVHQGDKLAGRHGQVDHAAGAGHRAGSQRSAVAREAARSPQTAAIARRTRRSDCDQGPRPVSHRRGSPARCGRASGPAAGAAAVADGAAEDHHARGSHATGASLVIEATEPVPYVATRPDPLTVLLDFRNVGAEGVANSVSREREQPDRRGGRRGGRVDRRAGLARPHHAGAAGRAPRPQRAQHRRRRLRSTRRRGSAVRTPPAARQRRRTRSRIAALGRSDSPIAALGLTRRPCRSRAGQAPPPAAPAPAQAPRQPAGQQPAAPPRRPGGSCRRRSGRDAYTGNPVSLDFQGADLRAVLRDVLRRSAG